MFKNEQDVIPLDKTKPGKMIAVMAAIIIALISSIIYLEISLIDMVMGLPSFVLFFFQNFFPPKLDNIMQYIPAVIDTIGYAIIATFLSTFIGLVLGILISENTNKYKPLRIFFRAFVSVLRNIPFVIWGALLVYIFGIGGIIGILALIFVTIGFLGKSYAESIDEISGEKLEALRANGASYFQMLFHGVIPQFVPSWINWTLFSFEINVRASTVLGLVGAGGIGVLIDTNINLFNYGEALTIIGIIVVIILATEFVTNTIRKRII